MYKENDDFARLNSLKIDPVESYFECIASCDIFDESLIYISKDNSINSYKNCINKIIDDFNNGFLKKKLNRGNNFVKEKLLESNIVKETISVYKYMEELNYKC